MMNDGLKDLKQEANFPEELTCLIEITKGSKNKYEVDKVTGFLQLDRVLHSSLLYPSNYGYIPNTLCEDGDALDIFVLSQEPIQPLTLVRTRPLGVFSFLDNGLRDDKIIAVCADDPDFNGIEDLESLPQHRIKEMEYFCKEYKTLENKSVELLNTEGREKACQIIDESVALYAKSLESK